MSIWPVFLLLAVVATGGAPRADGAAAEVPVEATTAEAAAAASAVVAVPAPAPAQPPTVTPTPPPATTRPAEEVPAPIAVGLGIFLVALALTGAAAAGVFRPGSILGPQRVPPGLSPVPVLLVLVIGGACWIGGQVAFFGLRSQQHAAATGGQTMSVENLSSADLAVLATVPALVALLVVLAGDVMFGLVRPIGLAPARLPRMLLAGLAGGAIAMLLMSGAGYLLTVFYDLIGYEHPSEHELLGAMKDAPPIVTATLVFGACVMAPLFEEVLFRGHVQTLLARLLAWRPTRQHGIDVPPPLPGEIEGQAAALGAAVPAPSIAATPFAEVIPRTEPVTAPAAAPRAPERPGMRWLAVILTSLLFASVHPLWTAPLIFLLSLCIGYAYERTGSLWVPIVMHAIFNISSTALFLKFQ